MKRNLLKSALLALMVLVGGNAWAQATTYFSQDYEADGATADWTTGTAGRFTPVILEDDGNHYLSVDQGTRQNNGCVLTSTSLQDKVAAGTDFTMTFDVKIGSSNNQSPVEFNIYDAANSAKILGLVATGVNATEYIINGNSTQKAAISAGSKGISDLTWMEVKLSRNGSLTYLTITDKATSSVVFARDMITTLSETGGLGKMQFITKRYNANFAIDNVVVREIQDGDVPAATPTNYTIKFVDQSSNTIKNDVVIGTIVGTEVSAAADYTAAIYVNDKKYIYVSGNNAITTVENEANNVITLVFREAATWNYTVNATGAESAVIKELASGKAFEEDAVTVPYPLYINVNGTLWTKEATNQEYRASVILNNENTVANWAYTATEKNNVIYCSEGEDISGMTISTNGNLPIRGSNAKGGVSSEDVVITTLSAGKYKLHVGTFTSKSSEQNIYIGYGETQIAFASKGNLSETASNEIELTAETEIKYFGTTSSADAQLDYLWIEKTGDYVAPFDPETAIVNPSFELSSETEASTAKALENGGTYYGWNLPDLGAQFVNISIGDSENCNGNAFGVPTAKDGNFYYYTRRGWNSSASADAALSTTLANLPTGSYRLTFAYKGLDSWDKDHNSKGSYLKIVAKQNEEELAAKQTEVFEAVNGNSAGANKFTGDANWLEAEFIFNVTTDGDITLDFVHHFVGGVRTDVVIDDIKIKKIPAIDGALAELKKAIDAAQALADSYAIGDVLFTYPATEIDPLTNAISTAQGVYDAAESVDAVTTATQTLNEFVATFAPAMNKPEVNKEYTIINKATSLMLSVANGKVSIENKAIVLFTEVAGGWVISNNAETPEYILKTSEDNWTLSTTTTKEDAYVVNFNLADGAYTIQGAKGLFGTDNTAAGSAIYANKAVANNGLWTIEEWVEKSDLDIAKDQALATINALPVGNKLFYYIENDINTCITNVNNATTIDEVNSAVATAKASQNLPVASEEYRILNKSANSLMLNAADDIVKIDKFATIHIIGVEGGWVITNADASAYIFNTGNKWTLKTTDEITNAYIVNFNIVEGGYTIQGANGLFGTDSTDEGSAVYADKNLQKNGLWDIVTKAEGEVTGIETMKAETAQKGIYNLNGQKVMKAQKGLYILNGKKVVVK